MRAIRALSMLSGALLLTVGAHVVAGGHPSGPGVVVAAMLLWPVALLASRGRRSARQLVPGLAVAQVAGHAVLGFLGGTGAPGRLSLDCIQHAAHEPGRTAGSCTTHPLAADPLVLAHIHSGPALPSGWMLAAHVVATLAAGLLLARGEDVLWRVLDLLLPPVPVLRSSLPPRPLRAAPLRQRASSHLPLVRPGRGPPLLAA
ncbi:hypothetical protein N865_17975 [Intrasporangium oryzae NRRL B-24470]|uniref:Uncharacterized protein n=1 Tax=Intrasporangium oryzae NRRL B-24470 TaxID=1386089 RepID=W9G1X8_9MICO|nr:hypothetical protein N865_17975 [Intrasporangium oryzae NRRL B-24470]